MNNQEKTDFLQKLGFTPVSENLVNNLEVKCNKCNGIFKRSFNSFQKGAIQCPECENIKRKEHLQSLGFTVISENIAKQLKVQCNKCKFVFERPYDSFKKGFTFCPGCENNKKLAFLKKLNFTPISENLSNELVVKCNKCGYVFKRGYDKFERGTTQCMECERLKKLEYLNQLGFTPISDNMADMLQVQCNNCGNIFVRTYDSFYRGSILCPKCHPYDSGFEKEVVEFIGECEQHNISILNGKELDIYLPEYKLAIECNGDYWHSEKVGKDQNYHLNKTKLCQEKGIQLIHIFESSWTNKKEIWKSILNSKLGRTSKIFARKCVLKEVPKEQEKEFLNTNHLQGFTGSQVCLGLYYQDELVELMSFGKPRFTDKAGWELIRLASKLNTTVVGGASKLFKHFTKNNKGTILSYSDNLYSDGSIYKQLGMEFSHYSKPGYFYFKGNKTFSRQSFMKHLLKDKLEIFDPNLTESENMNINGYKKIWDCGQSVWIFKQNLS